MRMSSISFTDLNKVLTKNLDGNKNIIFDFGGVLIDWNPRYFFKDYFNDDEKMEYFLKILPSLHGMKNRTEEERFRKEQKFR
jgi:FMN phosphatase YigB (HAD superfamily)